MSTWVLAFGCSLAILGLLTAFSVKKIPAWEARGFVNLLLPWGKTFTYGAVANLSVVATVMFLQGQWWQAVLLGLIAWVLVFTVVTDFATYKIPSETLILAYLLPLLIAIPLTWGDKIAYVSAGVWLGAVFLLNVVGMILKGGIGGSDIRLFWLVGTALSWWVGMDWMFYAFGVSAALQLMVFTIARLTGWGRIKPVDSLSALSKDESNAFKEAQKKAAAEGTPVPKGRKVLPFGPSILVTFLIMGIWAAAVGRDACSAYGGLICF